MEKLFSITRGAGDPPLTLVHGWTCDHGAMLPVADAFPGQRSTLVELLGLRQSPNVSDYSIEALALAALAVAPERSIWVGHSMGRRYRSPPRPSALPGSCCLIWPSSRRTRRRSRSARASARSSRFDIQSMMEAFARGQFVKASDPAAVERRVATMTSRRCDDAKIFRDQSIGQQPLRCRNGTVATCAA